MFVQPFFSSGDLESPKYKGSRFSLTSNPEQEEVSFMVNKATTISMPCAYIDTHIEKIRQKEGSFFHLFSFVFTFQCF